MNTHTKEFNKKAQVHLHRIADGVMKFCHGIKKKYTGMSTGDIYFLRRYPF